MHRIEEIEIEGKLLELTSNPNFDSYRRVFHRFGFGQRVEAMILSQIYPKDKLSYRVKKTSRYLPPWQKLRQDYQALFIPPKI